MRLTRIHLDAPLAAGAIVHLPETAGTHLTRVLRLKSGDECVLFNGDGADYRARLLALDRGGAQAQILERCALGNESPLRIVLAQALARGEKMDWVLQKATELGVTAIAPVVTERTEVRLGAERAEKRLAHWRAVIAAACEQSGRARLPEIAEPQALAAWAASLPPGALRLALEPEGSASLADLTAPVAGAGVALAVGPEGGFSPRDLRALDAAGFTRLRLGPRILRTETAGPAALAALQARWGDLG